MPYITPEDRELLIPLVDELVELTDPWSVRPAIAYLLDRSFHFPKGVRYSKILKAVGTIECIRQELNHRKLGHATNGSEVPTLSPPDVPIYQGVAESCAVSEKIFEVFEGMEKSLKSIEGPLNYVITRFLLKKFKPDKVIVNLDALLLDVSRVFYGNMAFPYEQKKMKINGDVC